MADFDPLEALKDPEFHKLGIEDKLRLLRSDPDFAGLDSKQQGEILARADKVVRPISQPEAPNKSLGDQVGDFVSTLGSDIIGIPGAIWNTVRHPIDTAGNMIQAHKDVFSQADEEEQRGNKAGAFAKRVAGSIPIAGPMINSAGEDIGGGDVGKGLARTLELAVSASPKNTSALVKKAAEVTRAGPVLKGMYRGANEAQQAASEARTGWQGLYGRTLPEKVFGGVGYAAGHKVGGYPGALIGGALGKDVPSLVTGAWRGAKQGWKEGAPRQVFDAEYAVPKPTPGKTPFYAEYEDIPNKGIDGTKTMVPRSGNARDPFTAQQQINSAQQPKGLLEGRAPAKPPERTFVNSGEEIIEVKGPSYGPPKPPPSIPQHLGGGYQPPQLGAPKVSPMAGKVADYLQQKGVVPGDVERLPAEAWPHIAKDVSGRSNVSKGTLQGTAEEMRRRGGMQIQPGEVFTPQPSGGVAAPPPKTTWLDEFIKKPRQPR